mmetsp:Transcript_90354/g.244939  ORF Transcript_90354/g.244939 Transcript_90354/m.244939 type:complete len:211 (-) Transcript_90354:704-1336(-)
MVRVRREATWGRSLRWRCPCRPRAPTRAAPCCSTCRTRPAGSERDGAAPTCRRTRGALLHSRCSSPCGASRAGRPSAAGAAAAAAAAAPAASASAPPPPTSSRGPRHGRAPGAPAAGTRPRSAACTRSAPAASAPRACRAPRRTGSPSAAGLGEATPPSPLAARRAVAGWRPGAPQRSRGRGRTGPAPPFSGRSPGRRRRPGSSAASSWW